MIRFLQPAWFWALAVLPLIVLWRGRRGPVAAVDPPVRNPTTDLTGPRTVLNAGINPPTTDCETSSKDRFAFAN